MKAEEAEYGDTAIYRHPTGLHNKWGQFRQNSPEHAVKKNER
jgi:hypothetical protein